MERIGQLALRYKGNILAFQDREEIISFAGAREGKETHNVMYEGFGFVEDKGEFHHFSDTITPAPVVKGFSLSRNATVEDIKALIDPFLALPVDEDRRDDEPFLPSTLAGMAFHMHALMHTGMLHKQAKHLKDVMEKHVAAKAVVANGEVRLHMDESVNTPDISLAIEEKAEDTLRELAKLVESDILSHDVAALGLAALIACEIEEICRQVEGPEDEDGLVLPDYRIVLDDDHDIEIFAEALPEYLMTLPDITDELDIDSITAFCGAVTDACRYALRCFNGEYRPLQSV